MPHHRKKPYSRVARTAARYRTRFLVSELTRLRSTGLHITAARHGSSPNNTVRQKMRPHHLNAIFRFVFSSVTIWLVLSVSVLIFGNCIMQPHNTDEQCYLVTKKIEKLTPGGNISEDVKMALQEIRSAGRNSQFRDVFYGYGMLFGVMALGVHLGSLWRNRRANQALLPTPTSGAAEL